MHQISRFLFFKILNWKIHGFIDPAIQKCVVIVAPHTSWYDFFLCLMVRRILNIQINFLGKKELFAPPFGWYFKRVGGTPLDRSPNQNKVEAIAAIFKSKPLFRLALSPEGTRKKTERWKTGFYYIALEANVPVIRVALDYASKTVSISKPIFVTGNVEQDLSEILDFYKEVQGKVPQNF